MRATKQRPAGANGSVGGHHLPPPRPTAWAALYFLLYVGVPLVGLLLLADLALFLVFTKLLGRCYGIACLLG